MIKRNIKILVVSNYRGLHSSRPEAEIFIALQKRGFDITIMTFADSPYIPMFENVGIKVIKHHPTKRWQKDSIQLIRKEIVDGNYDILQLYNNKAITNGIRAAKGVNVKVVIYRGAEANMEWYNPYNYVKFLSSRIDFVICNSESIRQKFLSIPFYSKHKPITILKGHDLAWYTSLEKIDIRKQLGIKKEATLFVTVANNRKVKGIPVLLNAISKLSESVDAHFLIIGEKMNTTAHLKLIEKSIHKEKVHLLGYRSDALSIVAECDVFILPSTGSEALTKSVIEAMAVGVPAIISDLPGNAPLIDHSENGWVFKSGDSSKLSDTIVKVVSERINLSHIGARAKQKIQEKLNHKDTVMEYAEFYKNISTRSTLDLFREDKDL